ncbi:uncharacterized protein F4812DRAFT_176216 [Daldinia caldariorum]|uniref:uncharacterized protein n=1 Tax=Daldinia caldariorum TaxID=326644 RepID=UPI00200796C1|nr:uncharacterized protein F4812DRAFT_176216 [Daldinia caldariorum]KAI1471359.1 hypothetical protein F4812DRAFT_176216 [Daldinia caldariorum]
MAENGAFRRFYAITPFATGLNDELGEDIPIPPVVSDILQPSQNAVPTAPLPLYSNQRNSVGEQKVQGPSAATSASLSQPRSQLAVHIRSSAPPSPSHIRQRQSTGISQEPQLRGSPTAARQNISVILPPVPLQRSVEGASFQPRKRGRPKGSYSVKREGNTENAKPSAPKKEPSKEPKRRGRPPRDHTPSVREYYLRSKVEYAPFLCEWKCSSGRSCPAELQNMKTLRRHVFLVHGDEDPLVCQWGKCAARDTPIKFASETEFEEHMEKAHFRSFVWHMGDGYQNEGISTLKRDADELPEYLFDEDGNQVTPSIAEQRLEDDQEYKERKRKLRRLLIQQDENAPTEEEWMRQTLGLV